MSCKTGGLGYTVTLTGAECAGQQITGKDFGNINNQPLPPPCKEDLARGPLMTRTVDPSKVAPGGGTGNAGSPINYLTVQAAYDAAKASPGTKDEATVHCVSVMDFAV